MAIPRETIEEVRQLADVVEVVGQTVALKKTGNHFSGLCPFHKERSPSFKVFPESQNFHCFGCDEGGSVFDFIMKIESVTFPEALRILADRVGVTVPDGRDRSDEDRLTGEVYETLELAARFYEAQLSKDADNAGLTYLRKRGMDKETTTRFRLGWVPDGWENLIRGVSRHRDGAALERAGLAIQGKRGGHYDRFRARVIYPIVGSAGRVVGFGGRAVADVEPKYLNTPETVVYRKSRVLYGLREARSAIRQEGRVLVVEGYMDVLALHQAGVSNAVATCGTSLTEEHGRILARHAPEIVFVFDGDSAGLRAALKGFETLLKSGASVRAVPLPDGADPDDVVRAEGAGPFRERCEKGQDLVDFFHVQSRGQPKPAAVDRLARMVALIPEEIPRRDLISRAADVFRFDERTFVEVVERLAKGRSGATPSRVLKPLSNKPKGLEAALIRVCLQDPEFWPEFESLMERPDLRRTVEEQVRPEALALLREVGLTGAAESPAAYRDRVQDPDLRRYLMEIASEGRFDEERLHRNEKDLVAQLPYLTLVSEKRRLEQEQRRSVQRGDMKAAGEILTRLNDVTRRLNDLGSEEEASSSP